MKIAKIKAWMVIDKDNMILPACECCFFKDIKAIYKTKKRATEIMSPEANNYKAIPVEIKFKLPN